MNQTANGPITVVTPQGEWLGVGTDVWQAIGSIASAVVTAIMAILTYRAVRAAYQANRQAETVLYHQYGARFETPTVWVAGAAQRMTVEVGVSGDVTPGEVQVAVRTLKERIGMTDRFDSAAANQRTHEGKTRYVAVFDGPPSDHGIADVTISFRDSFGRRTTSFPDLTIKRTGSRARSV